MLGNACAFGVDESACYRTANTARPEDATRNGWNPFMLACGRGATQIICPNGYANDYFCNQRQIDLEFLSLKCFEMFSGLLTLYGCTYVVSSNKKRNKNFLYIYVCFSLLSSTHYYLLDLFCNKEKKFSYYYYCTLINVKCMPAHRDRHGFRITFSI